MTDTTAIAPQSQQQRVEAVWRGRARRLSQRPNLAGAQDTFPVVVLGIGKERYGIDLQDVAEVFPPVEPTPVPGAPAVVAGVINVHGEIRPVVDLRRLLGIKDGGMKDGARPVHPARLERVVLLRKDGREVGLQIDSVEQIRRIEMGELQIAGQGDVGVLGHISPHIKGSTKDLLMLLSTDAIFAALGTTERHQDELRNGEST